MTNFKIGSLVTNFGHIAEVVSIEENGDLIVKEVSTLDHRGCGKWRANPALCQPYGEQSLKHKDGFVIFG